MRRGKKTAGPRHVLKIEAKGISRTAQIRIAGVAEKVRKAGNDLTRIMRGRLNQLQNSKRYRRLLAMYSKEPEKTERKAELAAALEDERGKHGVTWDACRKAMIPIGKKYGLHSVFALTKAEDIWEGVEKILFSTGHNLHFTKRGNLPALRAKQINRAIVVKPAGNRLVINASGIKFEVRGSDDFEKEELRQIIRNMTTGTGGLHLCYASITCVRIRGRLRIFMHFTVDGRPVPKYDWFGNIRHPFGKGIVGVDIGTQTAACACRWRVWIKNLADRGEPPEKFEARIREILQAMDRSRRAMNPGNYNADGTVRKGPKKWKKSKNYRKLEDHLQNLYRKRRMSRKYSVLEDANRIRELGDVLVTEPKNSAKLAKRAKKTTCRPDGRPNRKKRFGHSIQNRCPGAFQAALKSKFEGSGGEYVEVPPGYRASQYDHTSQTYVKKALGTRMYKLSDGTTVQRDMYAAYLMFCRSKQTGDIDQNKAQNEFGQYIKMQDACIAYVRQNGLQIKNSGIC